MNQIEKNIINVINKIKPYLNNDGGDVDFIKFKDGICYVELKGACAGCVYADLTLHDTVEELIISEIPEVIRVENIKS